MAKIRLLTVLGISLLALTGTAAAAPAENHNANRNYVTPLSGREEVPPRETRGHGAAIFHLNKAGTEFSYKLTASNMTSEIRAGHIHTGTVGTNGMVVVTLVSDENCTTRQNGIMCEGTFDASDFEGPLRGQPMSALIRLMEEERAYVNVHTTRFPGGEIRGQINRGNSHEARQAVQASDVKTNSLSAKTDKAKASKGPDGCKDNKNRP